MKEVIILDVGEYEEEPYIHCCMYQKDAEYVDAESLFDDHKANHFMITLFTKNNFSGKVKMTLESITVQEKES